MSPNNKSDPRKPENPNESLVIPKWINKDYFLPIIQKDVKDFESIENFTAVAATPPGDNYASIMVRVVVDIKLKDDSEQQMSYILKTTLESDKGGDFVDGMGLFPKEKQMYQVHIPNFIRLYKEAGVDIDLAPKCLHIDESSKGITLVLEDLKRQKFANADRLKGFDMEHMRRVLHKVAELHAASAVAYEQNGPYEQMYYESMFKETNLPIFEAMGDLRNEQYKTAMREWQLPNVEEYIAKFPTTREYFDKGIALNKVNENEFNVLNHGDLWCNNIMFSGDRTLLVDFQVGKWGNPAQDLWYLITSSASLDIKVKEFDQFIQIYHSRLVECLKLLKYSKPIPTLRELHIMMIKYGDWGMITATGVLVIVLLPPDKDSSINMMLTPGPEGDAFRHKTFVNPAYKDAMVQLLDFLNNKGLL